MQNLSKGKEVHHSMAKKAKNNIRKPESNAAANDNSAANTNTENSADCNAESNTASTADVDTNNTDANTINPSATQNDIPGDIIPAKEEQADTDDAHSPLTAVIPPETEITESEPEKMLSKEPKETETETEAEKAARRLDNAEFAFLEEHKDNPYKNVFVDSLETVTADDLGKPQKKKKKDPLDIVIELFRRTIFWVALVVFFISGYQVVYKLYSYQKASEIYDFTDLFSNQNRREDLVPPAQRDTRLQTMTPVNGTREDIGSVSDPADNIEYNETFEMMKGQLLILRNKNPEVIGWIRMEGDTDVNYPIVQHEDNDYYLHYAYDGTYNPAGSIYLDYRNTTVFSNNRHSIIYGHNMESGSPMFSNLLHYKEDGFWDNNRYIDIYTDDALYTYEVFAAYETNPSQTAIENHSWRMNFNRDSKIFLEWVESVRARSDISPDIEIDENARVLTLSTCMNINDNRYVVHAVLCEVVN